jgi:membrane protease YdiL (CAAX protease family)
MLLLLATVKKNNQLIYSKKSFSILCSIFFIILNIIFAMIIYTALKIVFKMFNVSLYKNTFSVLTEFLTNLTMVIFLLHVLIKKLGIHIKPLESKYIYFYLKIVSFPILFYMITIAIMYYFHIPGCGFEIFKSSLVYDNILSHTAINPALLSIVFINFCLLSPIKEEIIIRKLLYVSLRKKTTFLVSSFLSSLIFGLMHGNPIGAFIYSIIASYIYEKYGNLKVNILMHAIINFLIIFVVFIFR